MQIESEKLLVWNGCAPEVAQAISVFAGRMGPYSMRSRHYPIGRLLEGMIDPALRAYAKRLPVGHPCSHAPGMGTEEDLSSLTKTFGFEALERAVRLSLGISIKVGNIDKEGVATLESIVELLVTCSSKKPRKQKAGRHETRNAMRAKEFCELCGEPTEFGLWLNRETERPDFLGADDFPVRPSVLYCRAHSSKAGQSNLAHKRAVRTKAWFDDELRRLSQQACGVALPRAKTGRLWVDQYIWSCVASRALYPDEKRELRNTARLWVDAGLTDRKKELLVLYAHGLSQHEIAAHLEISQQAVSRMLLSIPAELFLDVVLGRLVG